MSGGTSFIPSATAEHFQSQLARQLQITRERESHIGRRRKPWLDDQESGLPRNGGTSSKLHGPQRGKDTPKHGSVGDEDLRVYADPQRRGQQCSSSSDVVERQRPQHKESTLLRNGGRDTQSKLGTHPQRRGSVESIQSSKSPTTAARSNRIRIEKASATAAR